jgi:hypothetical protein
MREPQTQGQNTPPSDLDLLLRFEPVVAYTQGEMFFPMAAEGYVRHCSLWRRSEEEPPELLVSGRELTMDDLVCLGRTEARQLLSLRFVQQPMKGSDYLHWRKTRPRFEARGRLARVGLTARFVNAAFHLTLLLRGRVPGGTVAAAQLQYEAIRAQSPEYVYHGRVLRSGAYTVLNYQFFYAMNDWRSSFFGVNDHEADWEQVFVYLGEDVDGEVTPLWVAYASHDFHGDDLRRRWDDPELRKAGEHPIVYAGAGSHASYFQPGDYVQGVELKFLKPVTVVTGLIARFWRETLRQGDPESLVQGVQRMVAVPFIDYARGDGRVIGPGLSDQWTPIIIDGDVPWVREFQGLWGLDTSDIFYGEMAPAGPMYNRDGAIRASWYDPVGWVGLDKVPTPPQAVSEMTTRIGELKRDIAATDHEIEAIRGRLPRLALEVHALTGFGYRERVQRQQEATLHQLEAELAGFTAKREELDAALKACLSLRDRLREGYADDPQAHISHKAVPAPAEYFHQGRVAEIWAFASTGLVLLVGVGLIVADGHRLSALALLVAGAILVDSILGGKLVRMLLNITILLAVATAGVLIYEFFWQLSLAGIAAIGLIILWQNLRELYASSFIGRH